MGKPSMLPWKLIFPQTRGMLIPQWVSTVRRLRNLSRRSSKFSLFDFCFSGLMISAVRFYFSLLSVLSLSTPLDAFPFAPTPIRPGGFPGRRSPPRSPLRQTHLPSPPFTMSPVSNDSIPNPSASNTASLIPDSPVPPPPLNETSSRSPSHPSQLTPQDRSRS